MPPCRRQWIWFTFFFFFLTEFSLCLLFFIIFYDFSRVIVFMIFDRTGKTTLLRILAGKHMVGGRDVVKVLNFSAFHDTNLVCNGDLAYLGESWSKAVGSAVSFFFLALLLLNPLVIISNLNQNSIR